VRDLNSDATGVSGFAGLSVTLTRCGWKEKYPRPGWTLAEIAMTHLGGSRAGGVAGLIFDRKPPANQAEQRPGGVRGDSAECLGQPDEKSFRSADVAEPICVLVLDHLAADKLCAVLAEPGERIVDVVHGKHDA
jgi:hypothetical protein